ncbi:hypothetical protein A3D78_04570 [Candidatus Gottesmanbacteria bacterium RIFCSPHIGHO2_02_FULL_39_14]|uniref:HTH arsR-type domain-containing protein n=1 Tax=Candidatus Gottesmanbacteria bacterium RIFCSPHIGHO2_02_FULL_39_14 TaxID=1798383 RepID=A0A1F6A331_9BACT|nr:MAG: hypothetical protein A3D78_04570 [Candidatus Gottesmanbacteria bacterium RIFCSPHIGHO2_02_FULL_39_14]
MYIWNNPSEFLIITPESASSLSGGSDRPFDFVVSIDYNITMDIFSLTKSKTRRKILEQFLSRPDQDYYLHQLKRKLSVSVGNIRRELIALTKIGLFQSYRKGRLVYYKINQQSVLFNTLKTFMKKTTIDMSENIVQKGFSWVTKSSPFQTSPDLYCQTRDVFQVRLQTFSQHLEQKLGIVAYLVTALAGEIGNNSFDHNLGQWPDIPGIFFAHDDNQKIIVLADRGQGILKTIRNVIPQVSADRHALKIAFTQVISGRFAEKRGNGLKFVTQVLKDKKWRLRFDSGKASLEIFPNQKMKIIEKKSVIKGCIAVLEY